MAQAASNLWGAAKSGLGSITSGIGNALGGIGKGLGGFFGLSGPTGQPSVGGAGSTAASFSQATPAIPNFSAGSSGGGGLSAGSFGGASPIADAGGSGDFLSRILGNGNAQSVMDVGKGIGPINLASGGAEVASKAQPGLLSRIIGQGGSNIIPIGMLVNSAIHANDEPAGLSDLRNVASQMRDQGTLLTRQGTAALQGNLPGPAQSAIDQALRAVHAGVRSNYAGLGLTGSSMEQQDLNAASERALAQRFQIGQQMAQTGLNAASNNNNYSASLYGQIMQALTARDTAFGTALSRFAGNLAV